jgi:tetratricopeptide (TPR) repeat protein
MKKTLFLMCLCLLVASTACDRPERTEEEPEVAEQPTTSEEDQAAEEDEAVSDVGDIGEVDFQPSCNEDAQEHFEVGFGLLHHMWYVRAREHFAQAAEADEECAMAHWGLAMTHYTPLWAPPTPEEVQQGTAAIERAREIGAQTERERNFVEAIGAFYDDYEASEHAQHAEAFRDAWEEVHQQDPDDIEAASFYALGILATAPTVTEEYAEQQQAGAILEGVLDEEPQHPGGHHYLLHAYDFPPLAERALDVANTYADIAPAVPHALHMPSHIFVRLGMWDETIEWNNRSADAAEAHPVDGRASMHLFHSLDYVTHGYLQQGLDDEARQAADRAEAAERPQHHMGSAYASLAIPARMAIEQRDWQAAADIEPLHSSEELPLENWPAAEAVLRTVRAVGAINSDDVDSAQQEFSRLDELNTVLSEVDDPHWTPHVQAYRNIVEALLDYERGEVSAALEKMQQAATFQDSFDKHPIMPGRIIEAGEYLGMLQQEEAMYTDALQTYEQALEMTPNRFHLLYGAASAARMAEQPEVATDYYEQLLELADDQADRPQIQEARDYLEEQRAAK